MSFWLGILLYLYAIMIIVSAKAFTKYGTLGIVYHIILLLIALVLGRRLV